MKVLKSYKRIKPDLEQYLNDNAKSITFKNGDLIQEEKKICGYVYFIEKGLVRAFSTRSGKQKTEWFKKENDFIIATREVLKEERLPIYGIEALEDLVLWAFPGELMESACDEFVEFNQHYSIMMIKDMEQIEARRHIFGGPAEGWLDYLRQQGPDLLDRVPTEHLASFAGVSEKALLHMKQSPIHLGMYGKHLRRG